MTAATTKTIAAPTPELSGVEFATSKDGLPVARIGDLVLAMVTAPGGFAFIASAVAFHRPLTELTRADFIGHDGRIANEAEFRQRVAETANHKRELEGLHRVQGRIAASTPWGGSQMAIIYAEGVVAHMTAGHGGFHLSADRNATVHPLLRKDSPWYEEDCEWAIVAISFPDLFTSYERLTAEKTFRNTWPDAWETIRGCSLAPGESWTREGEVFDKRHGNDFIVTSAIRSDQNPGMTEVVARVGGGRIRGSEERRFLVPADEYSARGRFGFVIDPGRHPEYQGPSSFIGWQAAFQTRWQRQSAPGARHSAISTA
ncbi:hypothetical protein LPJGGPFB_05168 [Ensifer adhaerens]|uniref:DUF7007 domain-containing protein n=1 Tax=Ensifer adhaerens TaxID=106592 RepID=UPI001F178992|nr:hypothetical protein [Ensifer adhaerens]NRP21909.1 hypothetical protein [Ensifer adhaerens]